MLAPVIVLSIIFFIVLFFFLNCLSNLKALERLRKFKDIDNYPKVSILVPARNEERNIKRCVDSLLNLDYPNYEVLVLNDNSTDKTEEILQSYGNKIKYINGLSLPEDWLGKHWACHQLSETAIGDIFLFTDADTYHKKKTLRLAVSALYHEGSDFVTVLPKQEMQSIAEKITLSIIPWSFQTFIPLAIAKKSKRPTLSATIGQFMLFKKSSYHRIGGYEAIRGEVLDDISFGRRIKVFGLKWRLYDGCEQIHCHMYRNFKEVYEGLNKAIFSVFKNNLFYFFISILSLILVFLSPLAMLIISIFVSLPELIFSLSLMSFILIYLTWIITFIRFKYRWYFVFFYPVVIIVVSYICFSSMVKTINGSITWKGRLIKYF